MPFDVKDLTVTLGRATILNGISFRLPPRGVTGIIGPNGCGKSTLLRSLAGVLPTKGQTVLHEGTDIATLSPKTRARRIAMLPQAAEAPPGLTVRQLAARGRTPWLRPFMPMRAADHEAITRALKAMNMIDLADRQLDSLSGGQRQRAWIALVLAQASGTILLDEPLNFLDLPHQTELVHLLRSLAQSHAVIMIIHDLTIAARLCDHVVAMKAGRLIASGPPERTLAPANLRETFGIDFQCDLFPGDAKPVIVPVGL